MKRKTANSIALSALFLAIIYVLILYTLYCYKEVLAMVFDLSSIEENIGLYTVFPIVCVVVCLVFLFIDRDVKLGKLIGGDLSEELQSYKDKKKLLLAKVDAYAEVIKLPNELRNEKICIENIDVHGSDSIIIEDNKKLKDLLERFRNAKFSLKEALKNGYTDLMCYIKESRESCSSLPFNKDQFDKEYKDFFEKFEGLYDTLWTVLRNINDIKKQINTEITILKQQNAGQDLIGKLKDYINKEQLVQPLNCFCLDVNSYLYSIRELGNCISEIQDLERTMKNSEAGGHALNDVIVTTKDSQQRSM